MRRRRDDDRRADQARTRLLADLPVSERRLDLGGVRTALLEGGSGPPMVLLHGGIECGGVVWTPVVGALSRSHRLVIPDLPGLGGSDPLPSLTDGFEGWFADLLTATCRVKPTLLAHSLAGGLAARFAVRHGNLLDRLVISDSPAIGPFRLPVGLQVASIRHAIRPSAANHERVTGWFIHDLDRTRGQNQEWYDDFIAYTRRLGGAAQVKRAMRHLLRAQTKRLPDIDLDRIDVPVALLWGRHDRAVPLTVGAAASERHGWALSVIEGAGHVPQVEQPAAFVAALAAIVQSGAGTPPSP